MKKIFAIIGPGILVAATGVGAGDLITAGLAGVHLGLGILWAPILGAVLKWSLNEGLARWQLATGSTLLEGWIDKFGQWLQWVFLTYLIIWTFMVGSALVNACGVAGDAFIPIGDPVTSKIIWGIFHSILGVVIVSFGGFKLFEEFMAILVATMFCAVIVTAVMLSPDIGAIMKGIFVPQISKEGLGWILGVLGGVGGTLTILSYGYWIREEKRSGEGGLKICRIDLSLAYFLTAMFSVAMIIIGQKLPGTEAARARFPIVLAEQLGQILGPGGRWIFLFGFWGGVFSSLLGVWQSVPYLFTDFMVMKKGMDRKSIQYTDSKYYKYYLYGLATIPLVGLWFKFEAIQMAYAIMGALFMPLLAFTLLIMNNRVEWVGEKYKSHVVINIILIFTMVLFVYTGISKFL